MQMTTSEPFSDRWHLNILIHSMHIAEQQCPLIKQFKWANIWRFWSSILQHTAKFFLQGFVLNATIVQWCSSNKTAVALGLHIICLSSQAKLQFRRDNPPKPLSVTPLLLLLYYFSTWFMVQTVGASDIWKTDKHRLVNILPFSEKLIPRVSDIYRCKEGYPYWHRQGFLNNFDIESNNGNSKNFASIFR